MPWSTVEAPGFRFSSHLLSGVRRRLPGLNGNPSGGPWLPT
jgi:hypothetical protein